MILQSAIEEVMSSHMIRGRQLSRDTEHRKAMRRNLVQWFVFLIVVGIFSGYIAGRTLDMLIGAAREVIVCSGSINSPKLPAKPR